MTEGKTNQLLKTNITNGLRSEKIRATGKSAPLFLGGGGDKEGHECMCAHEHQSGTKEGQGQKNVKCEDKVTCGGGG